MKFKSLDAFDPDPIPVTKREPKYISKLPIAKGSFEDRCLGSLYGGIIGDIAGSSLEMKKEKQIRITIDDIPTLIQLGHPTDETVMLTSVIHAYNPQNVFNEEIFYDHIIKWYRNGAKGSGGLTRDVLKIANIAHDISTLSLEQIAKAVWEKSNRTRAGNGAFPRVLPAILLNISDPLSLITPNEDIAHITHLIHTDPRCLWSACLYGVFIAQHMLKLSISYPSQIDTFDHDPTLRNARSEYEKIRSPLDKIKMDGDDAAFCLRTIAFTEAVANQSFEQGILRALQLGGDTDTNAFMAGSLLGAKCGISGIPPMWFAPMQKYANLLNLINRFVGENIRTMLKTEDDTKDE